MLPSHFNPSRMRRYRQSIHHQIIWLVSQSLRGSIHTTLASILLAGVSVSLFDDRTDLSNQPASQSVSQIGGQLHGPLRSTNQSSCQLVDLIDDHKDRSSQINPSKTNQAITSINQSVNRTHLCSSFPRRDQSITRLLHANLESSLLTRHATASLLLRITRLHLCTK